MKLLILQGIPASGKSSWAKEFVRNNTTFIRVCRDDLRRMRGIYWLPEQEDVISKWEKDLVTDALGAGYDVVLDATNLNGKYLRQWVNLAASYKAEVEFKRFDTSLEECLNRDKQRISLGESVGEDVIRNMYKNYCKLNQTMEQLKAALDEKPFVVEKIVQDSSLPHVIICDLDGTAALMNGRGPYEFHRCGEDSVNRPVQLILYRILTPYLTHIDYSDISIIYLSGREDSCRDKTLEWIQRNLPFQEGIDFLFMRQTGDRRKDCIVKKEIFDKEIKGKYFVEFCLDDRDQVVKLWRDMGLTCLQVAEGNF